jgi:hypothetical protein
MRRIALAVGMTLLFTVALATPVAAKPVVSQGDWFSIQLDIDNGVVAFFNISRDDFCAWEASDFEGPAPVTTLLTIRENETPTGAIVFSASGRSSLELWQLDADADFSGPCPDTDNSAAPWAVGTARYAYHDNDLDHGRSVFELGLRRTNAFGESVNGRVVDASGNTWQYSWTLRFVLDKTFDFREVVSRFVLSRGS